MDKIAVQAPATTANLGPGFDCLGMALDIFNELTVEHGPFCISVEGEGAGQIDATENNLVFRAMARVFNRVEKPIPELTLTCRNRIPLARGLGSSAAAIASGLVAANGLLGKPLGLDELVQLGAKMEGHADNVAPALLGGCQLVVQEAGRYVSFPVPVPLGLRAVLFIPDFAMSTAHARKVLPASVTRGDAVFNVGRAALLTMGLSAGKLDYLRVGTQDRLHQPARQSIFPAMGSIFQAALEAGALGSFLSGAGSTILAFTEGESMSGAIGQAMQTAAARLGVHGRVAAARPTALGTHAVPATA
ncbi:MAG: homoserine kinase [Chloroflexi bacterium]|nr:homoserine kinase [Chloroflexota bacterium]